MTSSIMANWRDARLAELREWKLVALQKHARELGWKSMDPTQHFSLAVWVAEEELRRIGAEAAAESPRGGFEVPGAVLEDDENDAESQYEYPPADVAGVPWSEPEPTGVEPHWHNKILLNVDPRGMRTVSADSIVNVELPQFLEHWLTKNADYGDQHRPSEGGLGLRAEFVGLHRKFKKLRAAFWDGKTLNHEQPRELLWDTIGACLLMLDIMSVEEGRGIVADRPAIMPDPAAY